MSWLFESGGQSIVALVSASVLLISYSGLIFFRIDWFDLLGGILLGKTLSSWFSSICLTLTSLVEYNLYPKIFSL